MRKTRKYKKYKKYRQKTNKRRKSSIKRGGGEIDLRQIFITQPIKDAVKEYNPNVDMSQFKMSRSNPGFKLSRMENMMQTNFDELLQSEPVELQKAMTPEGKPYGVKIDGNFKQAYEIINGRHRIARSIIDGRSKINATIL